MKKYLLKHINLIKEKTIILKKKKNFVRILEKIKIRKMKMKI